MKHHMLLAVLLSVLLIATVFGAQQEERANPAIVATESTDRAATTATAITCQSGECAGAAYGESSNHVEQDVSLLNLTPSQLDMVMGSYESLTAYDRESSGDFLRKAQKTHVVISPHLAFRYYKSIEFNSHYHGRRVNESINETVEWRHSFGIAHLDTSSFAPLVQKRLAYTSPIADKHGRAIVYVRAGHEGPKLSVTTYVQLLMYTIERADRLGCEHGSGEFVTIVNLATFSWTKVPPISAMTEGITLLKKHYPYRLGAVYVINAGMGVDILWNIFKPLIPGRALAKIFFLSKKETSQALDEQVGLDHLETDVGGTLARQEFDQEAQLQAYFDTGYWAKAA